MRWVEKNLGNIEQVKILPISDLHIGDKHFNETKFKKLVSKVKSEPNTYITLGGDLVNNAIIGSVSDTYGEIKTPSQAKKWCIELLEPIRKKILGSEEPITCRPADLIPPELDKIKAQMKEYLEQDEDVLSYALFPPVAENFFKYRQAQKYKIDSGLVDYKNKIHPV
jgi:Icc-related predicted phosphoesterase